MSKAPKTTKSDHRHKPYTIPPNMSHHPPIPHPQPLRPSTGNQSPTLSTRPTSSAWSPEDDQQLLEARAQGMNWQPIAAKYFPAKSSNACRKRHERLVERQNSDNWDRARFEDLAKAYMECREEMWKILANRLGGEKWTVVEAKVSLIPNVLFPELSTALIHRNSAWKEVSKTFRPLAIAVRRRSQGDQMTNAMILILRSMIVVSRKVIKVMSLEAITVIRTPEVDPPTIWAVPQIRIAQGHLPPLGVQAIAQPVLLLATNWPLSRRRRASRLFRASNRRSMYRVSHCTITRPAFRPKVQYLHYLACCKRISGHSVRHDTHC